MSGSNHFRLFFNRQQIIKVICHVPAADLHSGDVPIYTILQSLAKHFVQIVGDFNRTVLYECFDPPLQLGESL